MSAKALCISVSLALMSTQVAAKAGSEFNGPEYIGQTRDEKLDKIWQRVIESKKSGSYHQLRLPFTDVRQAFDTPGDELSCGWRKCRERTIHGIGSVGKVKWIDTGSHPYTGIFKGGDSGVIRLSLGTPGSSSEIMPGIVMKFLRDGTDSANFFAMPPFGSQKSMNFFEKEFANIITPESVDLYLTIGAIKFSQASQKIFTLGVSDFASYDQDGQIQQPVFPHEVRLKPQVSFPSEGEKGLDYQDQLLTIAPGTKLFDIYALDAPRELGGTEQFIAELVTDSQIVPSLWGDKHLFFRHQRYEDDLAYKPEWEPYIPVSDLFGYEKSMGCPLGILKDLFF